MKKALLAIMLITGRGHAMEEHRIDVEGLQGRPSSSEIAGQIASLIVQYDQTGRQDDDQFKTLVVSFFKRESLEIQARIEPHLKEKLRLSDSDIKQILERDDRKALEALVHKMITESIEDAFKDQNVQFEELKSLADVRLKKARLALIATIATGVLGVIGTFMGAYFGRG